MFQLICIKCIYTSKLTIYAHVLLALNMLCSVQEHFPPHKCLYCCSVHTFLYLLNTTILPFTTMHFSLVPVSGDGSCFHHYTICWWQYQKLYLHEQRYLVHQIAVNEVILTYTYHLWSGFMTEVSKTDLSLAEIMTNLRDGWVQEKRKHKCRGKWTGQYTIKFSVLISVE